MKYLQTYKLFESFEKIDEKTIRDILIELEDDDIEVEINQIRKDRGDKSIHSGLIITDFFLEIYIRRPYGSLIEKYQEFHSHLVENIQVI